VKDLDQLYEEWQEYAAEAQALGEEVIPWDEYSGQTTAREKAERRLDWMHDPYLVDLY